MEAFSSYRELIRFIRTQVDRHSENLARAKVLIALYRKLLNRSGEQEPVDTFSDIIRSAVVLVHATLEDFLRSIAMILLPFSDETTLKQCSYRWFWRIWSTGKVFPWKIGCS